MKTFPAEASVLKRAGKGNTEAAAEARRQRMMKSGTENVPFPPRRRESRKTMGVIHGVRVRYMMVAVDRDASPR